MTDALCAADHVQPEWFDYDARTHERALATRICAGCAQTEDCRTLAVADKLGGTFGGVFFGNGKPMRPPPDEPRPRPDEPFTAAQAAAAQFDAMDRWADNIRITAMRRAELK